MNICYNPENSNFKFFSIEMNNLLHLKYSKVVRVKWGFHMLYYEGGKSTIRGVEIIMFRNFFVFVFALVEFDWPII